MMFVLAADLLPTPDMPVWIRNLLWIALVLGAVMSIRKHLRDSHILGFIAKELSPNSGGSVKDVLEQCAADSKRALVLCEKQDKRGQRVSRRLAATARQLAEYRESHRKDMESLRVDQQALKREFARFVIHEARNTLHAARLVDEEEKYLKEQDAIAKERDRNV